MKQVPAAWNPPVAESWTAIALQAVARGEADKDQQKRLLKWLVEEACKTYDLSFRPGATGDRETAFAEGRRFVGLQIVHLLKADAAKLREKEQKGKGNG